MQGGEISKVSLRWTHSSAFRREEQLSLPYARLEGSEGLGEGVGPRGTLLHT